MRKSMITVRSGCDGTPYNSMESIIKDIEPGADCVEIDIRMAADGSLSITHYTVNDFSGAVPQKKAMRTIAETELQ